MATRARTGSAAAFYCSVTSGAGAIPVGHDRPQFDSDGALSLTPVPPIPQYPAGFLSKYCWWQRLSRSILPRW
ncbi:hypothetical protein SAMN05428945_0703 [Streptomyces sp. 2224.1]|nr:hypothetical protein BX261_4738 [Streptomyces sp. 2321.6]SDR27252.1 hypothetical protein SAMN05216511_2524 [Streptomyces sp. KS_16]SEB63445.1 hypothetical protein SAMN05428945_0703 [Streptomyces sp. 2224.1]SED42854.1 hypothetical protein SAMN05428940_4765 [Streptomyces sp. 2133.1]SNC70766.1 hypothetical protein SAMN06272741_4665 [Streptomyces sp. 2114.4]